VKRILLAALLLASCGRSGPPDIRISDAWARETVAGQTATAAYMTIANSGAGEDRLIGVAAPAPAMAMLHSSESSGGVARMREMEAGVAIPAGGRIELKPGGSHVMVTGLGAPLEPGQSLKLTLTFEKSGERPVDVPVSRAAGPGN
jgi:periplasmic copper chaperone A